MKGTLILHPQNPNLPPRYCRQPCLVVAWLPQPLQLSGGGGGKGHPLFTGTPSPNGRFRLAKGFGGMSAAPSAPLPAL